MRSAAIWYAPEPRTLNVIVVCSKLVRFAASTGTAAARAGDYEGRVTFKVVLACLTAATGGMLFGYDLGVTGRPAHKCHSISANHWFSESLKIMSVTSVVFKCKLGRQASVRH